jgi:hypothetical protein
MKNVRRNFRVVSTAHLDFLRISAFACEGIDLTEKESAHFDACRSCRLKVIDALKNLEPLEVRTIMPMAA